MPKVDNDSSDDDMAKERDLKGIARRHNIDICADDVRVYVRIDRSVLTERNSYGIGSKMIRATYNVQRRELFYGDSKPCHEVLEFTFNNNHKSVQFDPTRHSVCIIKKKGVKQVDNESIKPTKNVRGIKIVVSLDKGVFEKTCIHVEALKNQARNNVDLTRNLTKTTRLNAKKKCKQKKDKKGSNWNQETKQQTQILRGRKRFVSQPRNLLDEFEREVVQ